MNKENIFFTDSSQIGHKHTPTGENVKMATGGNVLLAPNGEPSGLYFTEIYNLVRTPEFKNWFGDWEEAYRTKDYEGVSKIIDENGEPLICVHNTPNEFYEFDEYRVGENTDAGFYGKGFYFTPTVGQSRYGEIELNCFLNIKNPFFKQSTHRTYELKTDELESQGYDGVVVYPNWLEDFNFENGVDRCEEVVAYHSEQIKLGDGRNTTFDPYNADIRFRDGGQTNSNSFMNWYLQWYKGISNKMNILFSFPSEIVPFKEKNVVILDVFEKIDQNINAKSYLNEITKKADEYGVTIYLEPTPRHNHFQDNLEKKKKITKGYLIEYYEKFGFQLTPNKQFMKRLPENNTDIRYKEGGVLEFQSSKSMTIKNGSDLYKVQYRRNELGSTDKKVWFADVVSKNAKEVDGRLCFDNSRALNIFGFSLKEVENNIFEAYNSNELYIIIVDEYGLEIENTHIEKSNNENIRFFENGGEIDSKVENAKAELLKAFPNLNNLDFLGKGMFGYSFLIEINYELYVVKYTTSLTEFWATQMAMVSNAPHVVKFLDAKELSEQFTYGIIHEYVNRDGMINEDVWNYALLKADGLSPRKRGLNIDEIRKKVPPKALEYEINLVTKLVNELKSFFGTDLDLLQQNWGYNSNGELVLFDIDGNIKKAQYLEWMEKYKSEPKVKLSVKNKIKRLSKRILEIHDMNLGYEDDIFSYEGDLSFKERRKLFEETRKLEDQLTEVTDTLSKEQCESIDDENFQALNTAGDFGYEGEEMYATGGNIQPNTQKLIEEIKKHSEHTTSEIMTNKEGEKYRFHHWKLKYKSASNYLVNLFQKASLENTGKDYNRNFSVGDISFYYDRPEMKNRPNGSMQMKELEVLETFAGGGNIDNSTKIKSTEDLIQLVATARENKVKEWKRLGEKVVVGRNDGYWWYNDSSTDANFEIASNPSRRKILEIIKNNPSINELGFQGTIKVGSRVGEELEIVDDFSVTLWSKNNEFFKEGMTFEFSNDNGKYRNTIVNKNETEYKDRVDKKKFVYYKSVDKYGNVGEARTNEEVLKEDFDNGNAFFVDKMAGGGNIDINEPFNVNGKTLAERVRILLKQLYPDYKWSVTSSYNKLDVYLLEADFDPFTEKWKEEYPNRELYYNVDNRDFDSYNRQNNAKITDRAVEVFKPIREYIDRFVYNRNADDPYADYSDYNVYEYTYIGKWDKPYKQVEPKAGKKKPKAPIKQTVAPTTTPTKVEYPFKVGDVLAVSQEKLNKLSLGIAGEISQFYYEVAESINPFSRYFIKYNEYNESATVTVEVVDILNDYVKATAPLFKMGDTVVRKSFPNNPLKVVHRSYYEQIAVKYSTLEKRFLLSGMYWNYALEDATYANEGELISAQHTLPNTPTQPEPKFKVGDIVRYVGGTDTYIVEKTTYSQNFKQDLYNLLWQSGDPTSLKTPQAVAGDLELVSSGQPEPKFKVGDVVRYKGAIENLIVEDSIYRDNFKRYAYKVRWESDGVLTTETEDKLELVSSAQPTPQNTFLDYLLANNERANEIPKKLELTTSLALFLVSAEKVGGLDTKKYAGLLEKLLSKFDKIKTDGSN